MQISVRAAAKVLVVVLTKYGNGFVFQIQEKTGKRFSGSIQEKGTFSDSKRNEISFSLSLFFLLKIKAESQRVLQRDANRCLPMKLKSPQNWLLRVLPQ
ncbi:hypothetical protein CDAR_424851 [Caerostris darwini]|uniref:Uncharacterized protein n=1 Tax=Caerostris darwini TaxID=1538125 RepID=A0AAV4U1Q7_9ARAC|nr:hypothetical protein CDAR_424851 [Caerostris darwini]